MSLESHKASAPAVLRYAVITVSDTRDAGTDRGGPFLVGAIEAAGWLVNYRAIRRDEPAEIEAVVREAVVREDVDIVLLTGGTGLAPRDVTVPTLERLFEGTIPGFGELFRMLSYKEIGPAAILSRACAGLIARKVVVALPGSPKALALAWNDILAAESGHMVAQARGSPSAR